LSDERFRQYFELGLVGMSITSSKKKFVEVNDEFCRMSGYERDELVAMDWTQVSHPEDLPFHLTNFARILAGEIDGYTIEKRLIRKDGEVRDATISVRCVRREDKSIDCFLGMIQDITDRKRTEEALAKRNAELASSNKNLEDFDHIISHDLQSPLNKIAAFADLVKTELKTSTTAADDYLSKMQSSANRMGELISSLLRFSKSTTLKEELQAVDMNQVVEDVLSDLEIQVKETSALVLKELLPTVNARPPQMHQLLLNLIGNSLKYARENSPTVQLSCAEAETEWTFRVKDNCKGVDPANLGRIFDLFQRAETDKKGTGVGLTICRKIVESHGGKIWANSKPGKGTTFYFTLPKK
jgi:PAS domain S-box-containing protein